MWDAIARILTNANALLVLVFVTGFAFVLILLAKSGLVQITTGVFSLGADVKERDIIRQQVEWSHSYLMGLESEIKAEPIYGGYYTKYILERVYDEVIKWITFNHINIKSDYISIKQMRIKSIVYSFNIDEKFHSKDFERKLDRWTDELIRKLVTIREVYK